MMVFFYKQRETTLPSLSRHVDSPGFANQKPTAFSSLFFFSFLLPANLVR